ncbi:MAG: hypothetical protein ACLQUY_22700 [Ktedonobacterales bacterium]
MLKFLRQLHWTFLHEILGIPDHDHAPPHAPLSVILHSHPAVPAHHGDRGTGNPKSFRSQLDREMSRQPQILKSWQLLVGSFIERLVAKLPERS